MCGGATGHAEVVRVAFDPAVVSYEDLLSVFFTIHDPTTLNRQGNDVGTQYRSAIFFHSPEQERVAREVVARLTREKLFSDPIVTEIVPASTFHVAEDEHQEYYDRVGARNPYCSFVIDPKVAKFRKQVRRPAQTPVDSQRTAREGRWGSRTGSAETRRRRPFARRSRRRCPTASSTSRDLKESRSPPGAGRDARARRSTVIRRALYNEAVAAAKQDGEITGTDAHELAKIQKFLALRDDQVEKTKWDLQRLRTLTEIRRGNLPSVPSNSRRCAACSLEPEEAAHYSMSVEVMDLPSTRQNDGVRAEWGKPYEQGSALGHVLPEDGARPRARRASCSPTAPRDQDGSGKSPRSVWPEAQIYLYSDGMRLERTVGNTVLRFKSRSEETARSWASCLLR